MKNSWRICTVHAPRYFAGHIVYFDNKTKEEKKIEFFNCPIIPKSLQSALLLPGAKGSPFYTDFREFEHLNCSRILEIQYAISVFDRSKDTYVVEKFNHKFEPSKLSMIYVSANGIVLRTSGKTRLYKQYNVNEVMDGVSWANVPILQFIS
jgi:hypothetical protein